MAANGAFTFTTRLPDLATYEVTVKPGGLPTGLEQACTILGGTGQVSGAAVTSAQVRCTFTLRGDGGVIPDGVADNCNSPGAPLLRTVLAADAGSFPVGSLVVGLDGLNHPFVGDLTATLTHLATGTQATIFTKLGACGFDDDFAGDYRFSEAFSPPVCQATARNNRVLDAGAYGPCLSATQATSFSAATPQGFAGEDVAGSWQLSLTDNWSTDTGSVAGWWMTVSPP